MLVTLTRAFSNKSVTLGMLQIDGIEHVPLYTLELPWKDNRRNVSCIPKGEYHVREYTSRRFPDVWEIQNVPGRSAILIHAGNTVDDIEGCLVVGTRSGTLNGLPAVLSSRDAINAMRSMLEPDFTMVIR